LAVIVRPQGQGSIEVYDLTQKLDRKVGSVANIAHEAFQSLSASGLLTTISARSVIVRDLSLKGLPTCSTSTDVDITEAFHTTHEGQVYGCRGLTFHLFSPMQKAIDLSGKFRHIQTFSQDGRFFCFGPRNGSDQFCLDEINITTSETTELLAIDRTTADTHYSFFHGDNKIIIFNTHLASNDFRIFQPKDNNFTKITFFTTAQLNSISADADLKIINMSYSSRFYQITCTTDNMGKTLYITYDTKTQIVNFTRYCITETVHTKLSPSFDPFGSIVHLSPTRMFVTCKDKTRKYTSRVGAQHIVPYKDLVFKADKNGNITIHKWTPLRRSTRLR